MGQQQSSEKSPPTSKSVPPNPDKERKVNRRVSIQALSHSRAQPVDPSASNASAVAHNASYQNVEKASLEKMLQSTSPELSSKGNKVERSSSRASKQKKEMEASEALEPIQPPPQPQPIAVPHTAPSTHINIPVSATMSKSRSDDSAGDEFLAYQERTYAPVSQLRPPRLPLAIVDPRVPDSPTLMPVDRGIADVPIFDTDEPQSAVSDTPVRRRSSFQSEATQEEDETDELLPYGTNQPEHTVPTTIEWNQPGERVFVTGTFATWDRKYRLHKKKDGDGMYCVIKLPPGTHHLKFWVDSQMVTSTDLPTAVDFNNVLVNYIEISADDVPQSRRGSIQTTIQKAPTATYPTHPTTIQEDQDEPYSGAATPGEEMEGMEELPMAEEMPMGDYRSIIPRFLIDIDYAEDDPRYRQAAEIISDGSGPPTLPMFLNRSILNGNTPVKDDGSVLTLPNHTVLNHLMTSSVKNGVLATSVTTRYKKKYVTTISFKPVPKFDQK